MGLLIILCFGLAIYVVVLTASKKSNSPAKVSEGGLWMPRSVPATSAAVDSEQPESSPSNLSAVELPATRLRRLEDLSWQEFELMTGELFRRQGYEVEVCAGDGADGGVDLRLRKDGLTTLVQCKHWKVYRVGPAPVRELFGILMAEGAHRAVLLTTGRLTRDAVAFAQGKPLELVDGEQLQALVAQVSNEVDGNLLDVARWSRRFALAATVTKPACPFCQGTMVLRQGRKTGTKFWGCQSYPRCRGKRNVRAELLPAGLGA